MFPELRAHLLGKFPHSFRTYLHGDLAHREDHPLPERKDLGELRREIR